MPFFSKMNIVDDSSLNQFSYMMKMLTFLASLTPTRETFFREARSAIYKCGTYKNIALWSHWTPDQNNILTNANTMNKVILVGGNGTGKTLILQKVAISKAKKIAKDETITFLIHSHYVKNFQNGNKFYFTRAYFF